MKNTKETKRLSLEDFKVKKIESKNEIDKLMGNAAANCHYCLGGPLWQIIND